MLRRRKIKSKKLVSVLLEALAIVLFWRGIWGFLDMYLFPNDPFISYAICTVLGIVILFLDDFSLDELSE